MSEKQECNHTEQPSGYVEWHEWADKMSKTHKQTQCPVCKLWAVWIPKKKRKHDHDERGWKPEQ